MLSGSSPTAAIEPHGSRTAGMPRERYATRNGRDAERDAAIDRSEMWV
jgi:hypothetical protein